MSAPEPEKTRREVLFRKYHKQASEGAPRLKPFAPYFIDQLVNTMRRARCLSERVYAWALWRSGGNGSKYAVSDWDEDREGYCFLDQTDCALDLAWFEEGRPVEWVEGAPRGYRERARKEGALERPAAMKEKTLISKAFARNEADGRVGFDGRKIEAIVSPSGEPPRKLQNLATFDMDKAFLAWWKVAEPCNFERFEEDRKRYFATRRVAQNDYKRFRTLATSPVNPATSERGIIINVQASSLPNDLSTHAERPTVKVEDDGKPDLRASLAFGFAAFWAQYPRQVNRKAAEHAWDVTVTPETVQAALACLQRYLESDEVRRGVVRNPDKWLYISRNDSWEGQWPKSAPPKEKPDFVSNVTRVIEDNLRKTGKPW